MIDRKNLSMNCENCGNLHDGSYASGRFCSNKCCKGFSTKNKRKEINEKVSNSLKKYRKELPLCEHCKIERVKRKGKKFCSGKCSALNRWQNQDYSEKITLAIKKRCSTIEEKIRLREIGRRGGFGTKGTTDAGVQYQSKLERDCFLYLEKKQIAFIPHRHIPNSSKISDIYIHHLDLWIELDGINREKNKKWLGNDYDYWLKKLEIYQEQKLNYKIFYSLQEVIDFFEK
jgi:hypothetical protein